MALRAAGEAWAARTRRLRQATERLALRAASSREEGHVSRFRELYASLPFARRARLRGCARCSSSSAASSATACGATRARRRRRSRRAQLQELLGRAVADSARAACARDDDDALLLATCGRLRPTAMRPAGGAAGPKDDATAAGCAALLRALIAEMAEAPTVQAKAEAAVLCWRVLGVAGEAPLERACDESALADLLPTMVWMLVQASPRAS